MCRLNYVFGEGRGREGPPRTSTGEVKAEEGGGEGELPEERHTQEPPLVHESDSSGGLVGFAAIKYTAIVVIVLAILAFLGWYVLPRVTA